MFLPNAEFWRLWARASAFVLAVPFLVAMGPHAEARPFWHAPHHHARFAPVLRHYGHRMVWHRRVAMIRLAHITISHRRRYQEVYPMSAGSSDRVAIALRYLGGGNPTGSGRAWCGDFMNMVEHQAGRMGVRSGLAWAWSSYGRASAAVPGAIAVQRGHVAIVMERIGDRVKIISGNWGHRVGIGWISLRSAIYRAG